MTTRKPLQPLSPPVANIINTGSTRAHTVDQGPYGTARMQAQMQDDAQEVGSVVSGLSSLENDADDFDRLMIQNERDQRRLNEARHGRLHAFRKARTHPRVGLTMDNLEKNNARNDAALAASAHAAYNSPPSSNGSARSDPAIHAPASWGRKGRSNRNWMRAIAYEEDEEEEQQRTPVAADDTINGQYDDFHQQTYGANMPRRSVEDSPLSHKSSVHGTPQHDRSQDWDLTFELNEASMIASTPYIPRSTRLDDIRQIEIENLREQAITTAQTDRARDRTPEPTPRPRAAVTKPVTNPASSSSHGKQPVQKPASPDKRTHTRTKSWQSIGKSQPVTGTGKDNSPVAIYKSVESIVAANYEPITAAQPSPPVRAPYRREDSQDLLRRLARVSNTPSPARVAPRPQTAPARPPDSSAQPMEGGVTVAPTEKKDSPSRDAPSSVSEMGTTSKEPIVELEEPAKEGRVEERETPQVVQQETEADVDDIDSTPAPIERFMLNPKTPVVTGAWIDTPRPQTSRKADVQIPSSSSRSARKSSPRKNDAPKQVVQAPNPSQEPETVLPEPIRPSLPHSALQALVQEAKSSGRRSSVDYGDSTINSLEELITPILESPDGEQEEDTLLGIPLPTSNPRNEAERQRQQEVQQLHSMNARLRAARTSIRHANRGMQRVEERIEHAEEDTATGRIKTTTVILQHEVTVWSLTKNIFWHEPTRLRRCQTRSLLRYFGGLTPFTLFIIFFTIWGLSEVLACNKYCRREFARYSPHPYAVDPDAPEPPFVVEALLYRNLIKPWWPTAWSSLSWRIWWLIAWIPKYIINAILSLFSASTTTAAQSLTNGMDYPATAQSYFARSTFVAEDSDYGSMLDDQVI